MIGLGVLLVVLVLACLVLQDPHTSATYLMFDSRKSSASFEKGGLWSERMQVEWKPCPWWKDDANELPDMPTDTTGYIKVECTGGLNQMRRDLCDGVGIARLLNATLLIPHFDAALYWNDTSDFADIFDVNFFINQTKGLVHVVKELPEALTSVQPFFINCWKRKAPFDYIEEVLPALQNHKVVIIRPAASQRSDRYPLFAKSVRCQACYHAIRLVKHLEDQAKQIMEKIPRPFLALHLRFEPDMIAYSQCKYPSLSKESAEAVEAVRDGRDAFTGEVELSWRKRGKCLLTPSDVALILQALHVPTNMPIYLATGDGLLEKQGFTNVYTNIYNKSMLLDGQASRKLRGNSRAALDYYISVNSDYYIATYFGNMEKMVMPMRVLKRNWNTLVLNRKDFGTAILKGFNASALRETIWQSHKEAFIRGRGLALPDCFCESIASEISF